MHQLITKIGKGQRGAKDLSWGEAKQAAQDLMEGNATPYQAGAFLMAMRIKLEGVTELASFTAATRSYVSPNHRVPAGLNVVDVPVYAEKHNTQHVCLPAAIVAAAAGATILFHGMDNPTASSDLPRILEQLGIPATLQGQDLLASLQRNGFAYLDIALYHPPLAKLLALREQLGAQNLFHQVARLLNPIASALASGGRGPSAVSRKDAGSGEHARWASAPGFSGDGRLSRTVDGDPDDHAGTA